MRELTVEGMTCDGCRSAVERVVRRVHRVTAVPALRDPPRACVEGDFDRSAVVAAVTNAGYTVPAEP